MLTVLIVEDQEDLLKTVKSHLESLVDTLGEVNVVSRTDFQEGVNDLARVRPDILILDWFEGDPIEDMAAGESVFDAAWEKWFCPIVVYSAGLVDEPPHGSWEHPFLARVAKGSGSELLVGQHVGRFRGHVEALNVVREDISRITRSVLRDVAPPLFSTQDDDEIRREVLLRSVRRRVAATMDDPIDGQMPHAWEMYIWPSLAKHLLAGDMLRLTEGGKDDPSAFRVVLTPTCDMVPRGGTCKVSHVLVARCGPATSFGSAVQLPKEFRKGRDKFATAINEAHQGGYVLLPAWGGEIPMMSAHLRDLELIPIGDVGIAREHGSRYERVASLDSPFREQLMWAHLQMGCRPGIPPRDMRSLIEAFGAMWDARPGNEGK